MTDADAARFDLNVPQADGDSLSLPLQAGDILFLLGANGTGKSSLVHRFYVDHFANAVRISAHRQTWLSSSTAELSARQKQQQESQVRDGERRPESRWRGNYDAQRPGMAIFNLIDAENSMARRIASAVRSGHDEQARELAENRSPIEQINALLQFANLPVTISIEPGDEIRAERADRPSYSMAEMSDGERNAVLVAADVLTAKPHSLFLIDEPERHLHRSIIVPLLGSLFSTRTDSAFVVSTHELGLPLDFLESRVLLLRECHFDGGRAAAWDADLLGPSDSIDETLKRDVLGARRAILFVEGKAGGSLDSPLYKLLFPDHSIIPKGSQGQVIQAVKGLRSATEIAWVDAIGIVDGDDRPPGVVARLLEDGIHALKWHSVESIYYHPEVQRHVAQRRAELVGGHVDTALAAAREGAIERIGQQVDHLAQKAATEAARRRFLEGLPSQIDADSILEPPSIDVPAMVEAERATLQGAVANDDLESVLARYPIKETGAPDAIAKGLGFQSRPEYERAVLRTLSEDQSALAWVESLFQPLLSDVAVPE